MLDIHVSLMLFVLVLFLALIVILNRMLYNPLIKFMDDRDNSIAKDLNDAKSLSNNSETIYAESEEILNDARAKAAEIRQKSIDESKALAESKAESKRADLEKKYLSFVENLESEKENLKNSLISQIPLYKESIKAKFSKL